MRLRVGRPRAALIVAPHPDDEVIGAAHLLRALVRAGTRVRVVVASDGAGSHRDSPGWPRARLVAERRRESRRALRRIGVPAAAVRFLALPDGDLAGSIAPLRQALRRASGALRPVLVIGPAADDDHPDHRATAAALAALPGRRRRLAYRVWPPHRLRAARARRVVGPAAVAKRSLVRCYRTQTGAITDDPGGFAIAPHELAVFAHPVELYREAQR